MKKEKKATVKDVALKAGVSTATVSRVINGNPKVRPETAMEVKKIIEETGYTMNRIARSLKTNRTHTIGIIAPEFNNEFFMNVVSGIEDECKKSGYSVILCSSRENEEEEIIQLEMLKQKSVDGIILIPGSSRGDHLRTVFPIPLVLVDREVMDFTCDAVLADNYMGAHDSVELALKEGVERIGFIGGDIHLSTARERFEGYNKALKEHNIIPRKRDILFGDYHESSGYNLMKQLIEQEDAPENIFISNYFMHLGAARYLLEKGRPGGNLNIISFDDMPLASFFPYSSIIVAQPMEKMGHLAAQLLITRIGGNLEDYPRVIRMKTTIRSLDATNPKK